MKWYQFIASQAGASWRLAAGVDEEQLQETLRGLMDHQAEPTRLETHLLAITIIRQKAGQLIQARTGHGRGFHFSDFETLPGQSPPGDPAYVKGGLSLCFLS